MDSDNITGGPGTRIKSEIKKGLKGPITRGGFLKILAGLTGALGVAFPRVLWGRESDAETPAAARQKSVSKTRKPKKLVLLRSHVAGAYYYDAIHRMGQMRNNDRLVLRREPENIHDKNAIEIYWKNIKAGYVPRKDNPVILNMLDQKIELNSRITNIEKEAMDWIIIHLEISMRLDPS